MASQLVDTRVTQSDGTDTDTACGCSGNPVFDGVDRRYRLVLWAVIAINAAMFFVEMIAGKLAGSQALQADAQTLLAGLDSREARILAMRFGIGMSSEHTLEEIGREFGITRERVRQIANRALRRLRRPGVAEHLRSFHES